MKENKLKKLSIDDLKKRENLLKIIMGLFIPIIILLLYFSVRDKLNGGELEMPPLIIAISSFTILLTILPQIKAIQHELKERNRS